MSKYFKWNFKNAGDFTKDLEEVRWTPYLAWVITLTGLLREQNLNQTLVAILSIFYPPERRQDPTAITEHSDKMYLLCRNGKHPLQLWQSVSLNAKSFLIENQITFYRNLGNIQVGFYRWLFLSVQVKPVCPSSWFQGLTNNPQNKAKSSSQKLSTKKYKEYQPHVLTQLCHQGHRMNASEKNKKRNKNYNIRSKENEEKKKRKKM